MYAEYDLAIPETLSGALGILADGNDPKTVALAGGTNLIIDIRSRRERPGRVVGLGNIDGGAKAGFGCFEVHPGTG